MAESAIIMPILQMRKQVCKDEVTDPKQLEAVLGVRCQSLGLSFHAIPSPATWGQHVPAPPGTQQQAWGGRQGGWALGWWVGKICFLIAYYVQLSLPPDMPACLYLVLKASSPHTLWMRNLVCPAFPEASLGTGHPMKI